MTRPQLDLGGRVALHDGVDLAASVYRPSSRRVPAIVVITPYGRDRYHRVALDYARADFAFLAADCRGRGGSTGTFVPFECEGTDLAALVKWTGEQAWCDGRVATYGASYSGFAQWSMMRDPPAALAAAAPTASVNPALEFPFGDGIARPYALQWLTHVSGPAPKDELFSDREFWRKRAFDHFLSGRAFRTLGKGIEPVNPSLDRWLDHRVRDRYWLDMIPNTDALARFDRPVLSLTGQYDADLPGALSMYEAHLRARPDANHRLVIGPWDHAGTRTSANNVGGIDFGAEAQVDLEALQRDWFAHCLHGRALPPLLAMPFTWFHFAQHCGGRWRQASSLSAARRSSKIAHLSPGRICPIAREGAPEPVPPSEAIEHLVSDPTRLRPEDWSDPLDSSLIADDRESRTIDGDGLIFLGDALDQPLELCGTLELRLSLSCTSPDADLLAIVQGIATDGTVRPIMKTARRLRYRNSFERENLCDGERFSILLSDQGFVGLTLDPGTRIRLTLRALNSPYWEKNWQAGGPVADETFSDARKGIINVFTGGRDGSRLILPAGNCAT